MDVKTPTKLARTRYEPELGLGMARGEHLLQLQRLKRALRLHEKMAV